MIREPMRELRCKICNKLLFKHNVKEGELSIKCLKCKTITFIDFTVEKQKSLNSEPIKE